MGTPRVLMNQSYTDVRDQREDDWMKHSACADDDPMLYDERYEKSPPASVRCFSGCVVRGQCFVFALNHDFEGVWGGTTYRQRRTMQRRQRRVRCPGADCGGTDIAVQGDRATCIGCGLSWPTVIKKDD